MIYSCLVKGTVVACAWVDWS